MVLTVHIVYHKWNSAFKVVIARAYRFFKAYRFKNSEKMKSYSCLTLCNKNTAKTFKFWKKMTSCTPLPCLI